MIEGPKLPVERLHLAQGELNAVKAVNAAIEQLILERDGDAKFTRVIEQADKVLTYLTKLKCRLRQ